VVCTRDRPDRLRSCLHALSQQDHPRYDITVVDNAPSSDATARLVEGISSPVPVRRIVEPQPGLSRARNTGLRATTAGLIAFLDDDELPDEHWLSELALGFQVGPAVGCVTGMILPASLETRAQAWFEEYGGHSKNRGFTQLIFDPLDRSSQHPLYPLPPYGAGGNMAFRREALLAVGGFDLALGAGTLAKAGEDTAAFADIMLEGYQLVYQPSALLWHNHHQDFTDLQRQLYGYGAGLTAYFVRMLIRRPKVLGQLLALAPRGIRDLLARDSQRFVSMQAEFPQELLAEHRRGMLRGLTAYPRAVWRQRRAPVPSGEGA
jgi:GT2 family glycosyltransferase